MRALRDVFGESLAEAGQKYSDVVAVSCDLRGATRLQKFFDVFPERSIEVGIAEANAIGISTGLALSGFRPFIASFGAFISGKNVEIRTSIAYNKAPVVVVGTHGGLIGPDGATQAALQDISVMKSVPFFQVLQPASPIETEAIIDYAAQSRELIYLRIARNTVPEIYDENYRFTPGKGHTLRDGDDITLISSGPPVHAALEAADHMDCASVRVVNMPSIKPFDSELAVKCAKETKLVVVVEDHSIEGGLGSTVAQTIAASGVGTRVNCHGIGETFAESGSPQDLESAFGLDAKGIFKFMNKAWSSAA